MKASRTLILNALLIFIFYSCTPENPTPNPPPNTTYTVKYVATGNADYYLYNIYNSTGGTDSYQLPQNQDWTYEFQASTGHPVGLSIDGSEQLPNAMFSLKIYLNGVLWKEANGGPDIGIMAFLP